MKAIMYHYVREFDPALPYFRFLDIKNFRKQLSFFEDRYGFVTKDEWLAFVESGRMPKQAGKIILTFDDAMSCHYEYVFPELIDRNLWGIFYVPTAPYSEGITLDVHRIHLLCGAFNGDKLLEIARHLISDQMIPDMKKDEFKNKTYTTQDNYSGVSEFKRLMNYFISYQYRSKILDDIESTLQFVDLKTNFYVPWESLFEMRDNGMIIGSHSVNHPVMSKLSYEEQEEELRQSFALLGNLIDPKFVSYCHPYGGWHSFDFNTTEILNKLNVVNSFMVDAREITDKDFNASRHTLPRYDCNIFKYGRAS